MALFGFTLQSRILLRDLEVYYDILKDKAKQNEIRDLISKMSK